jgi:hypothetical protein
MTVATDRVQFTNRAEALVVEFARRSRDGFALYRPRPEVESFHRSKAPTRVVRGGVRSGKTCAAAAEVASAILGRPIATWDGETIPMGWPTDRPLLLWFIGFNEKHIARMYKKLFKPGLFRIIQDRTTKEWRAWRPTEPDDMAREKETKDSPPLIPARLVEKVVWNHAGEQVPSLVIMKNGTEMHWFTSGGEAGVGDAIDGVWIDEDVKYPSHVAEWQSRLADKRGRMLWSSWPRGANRALRGMVKRAEEQADWENPDVALWTLTHSGNPYIPEQERRRQVRGWKSEGEGVYLARDLGLFADGLVQVFPQFDIDIHGIPGKGEPDPVEKALLASKDLLPRDWSYYLGLDPGHAHAAAVIVMVPPTRLGKSAVVRESMYFERYDHYQLADAIAAKYGHIPFQAFIIDWHAARMSTIGRGERPYDLYTEAFERAKLKSAWTDCGFAFGNDNIAGRNMVVREWLDATTNGKPRLRLVAEDTHPMQKEFDLYRKRVDSDQDVKEEIVKKNDHTMDALGYVMSYLKPLFDCNEAWQPPPKDAFKSKSLLDWEAWVASQKPKGSSIHFGPGYAPESPIGVGAA